MCKQNAMPMSRMKSHMTSQHDILESINLEGSHTESRLPLGRQLSYLYFCIGGGAEKTHCGMLPSSPSTLYIFVRPSLFFIGNTSVRYLRLRCWLPNRTKC